MMNRFIERLSVRRSMILLMTLVTLPVVGLIAYSVQKSNEQSIAESAYLIGTLTANEAADFDRTLNESRDLLQKLAKRSDIRTLDPRHCAPVLGEIKQLFSLYANVAVVNRDGQILCSEASVSGYVYPSVRNQAWFAQVKETNKFSISQPHFGPVSRKWVLALNQPIRDAEGRFAGVVGYSLDLGYGPILHRARPLPKGVVLTLVNRQGIVVIQSENGTEILGKTFSDVQALKINADVNPITRVIGNGPNARMVSIGPLQDAEFRVYGTWPMRYIAREQRHEAMRQLAVATLFAAISIILAWYIGRKFSLQLEKMARAVSLVAGGDLTTRIAVDGPAELTDLARTFNHMLDIRFQAEARYHSLFEAASDGVVVVNSTSQIILANSRAHQIFGYEPGQLMYLNLNVLIPECSRAIHAQHVSQYLASPSGQIKSEAHEGHRKNGDLFNCEIKLTLLKTPEGAIVSVVIHDLSEIERGSRRYLKAIDTAVDGYAVFSVDGKFLEANSALIRRSGYSMDELSGMSISDMDAQHENGGTMIVQDEFARHPNGRLETIWRRKDGQLINVELSYSHHEEAQEIFCFIRNISAAKKSEMNLKMSMARVRNLERAINEHAIVSILDEAENITFVNDKFCAISQHSRDQLLGKHYRTVSHDLHSEEVTADPRRTMFDGQIWVGEIRNKTEDGACYWVDTTVVPFRDGNDEHAEYFIIQRDITRRKKIEEDLLQSTELLRHLLARHRDVKEAERTRIAREIHDDLGGLLHGIKSHLSVATKYDVSQRLRHQELIADAMAMADQAIESVRRIIAELRPSVLDQLGVWAAIESHIAQIEERSHLCCRVTVDPMLNERTLSDEGGIAAFRIVQELMMNVIRHADASMVEVDATCVGDQVQICVTDDGKGIGPAEIFGENSWGIMGMYERARYCGGELKITRSPHRGTAAVLTLPQEGLHD